MNEATKKALTEQKDKLLLAESADEIKDIVTKAGGEITAEDAEHIMTEIKRTNAPSGTDIDDDEMDTVAGGSLCDYCFNHNWCQGEWYCYWLDKQPRDN